MFIVKFVYVILKMANDNVLEAIIIARNARSQNSERFDIARIVSLGHSRTKIGVTRSDKRTVLRLLGLLRYVRSLLPNAPIMDTLVTHK